MTGESGFLPGQRLWTPWRLSYVGGDGPSPGCVFCGALEGKDDAISLIVHRGEHTFAIMNLFPYNAGHLMVVPYSHARDLTDLTQGARAEMAELTASFCAGLRLVMGCDGLNIGMNLGSAAGAGIAEHVHQHIVPRWIGDANFMPIVGGVKVLPELVPATYAKIRAEVARQKSGADTVKLVMIALDRAGLYFAGDDLPAIPLTDGTSVWKSAMNTIATESTLLELLGWAGDASTASDALEPPVLAFSYSPRMGIGTSSFRLVSFEHARPLLGEAQFTSVVELVGRLELDTPKL